MLVHDRHHTEPRQASGARSSRSATTYRAVFAAGEFRVLFAGMLMYVLGFEFEILGPVGARLHPDQSAFLTALAFSMGFAPQAIGGALFTALADRLPPRLVIGSGLLTRAVPGLVIGLSPALPVPVMLALVAVAPRWSPRCSPPRSPACSPTCSTGTATSSAARSST